MSIENPNPVKLNKNEMLAEAKKDAVKQRAELSDEVMKQQVANVTGSIESFRDTPINPLEKAQYTLRFNSLKAALLASLVRGASIESITKTLKGLANRNGHSASIGLSELQPLSDQEVAGLNLDAGGKATLENFSTGGKLYETLSKAELLKPGEPEADRARKEKIVGDLLRGYLTSIAENIRAGKNPPGCGNGMLDIMQTVLSDTVGAGKLTLAKFEEIRGEIQSKYGEVFQQADESKTAELENLIEAASSAENPEEYLIDKRADMYAAIKTIKEESSGNAYKIFARQYGGLKYVVLFAAEKWIYATLGLNALMHGTDALKNPAFLTMAAVGGGIYAYNNQDVFKGKSEAAVEKKDALTEELEGLRAANPTVADWLGLVEEKDLRVDKPLGMLLAAKEQRGEFWVSSEEIDAQLKRNHSPAFTKIFPGEGNPNGEKLYQLLTNCKKSEVSPSQLLRVDPDDKPETNNA